MISLRKMTAFPLVSLFTAIAIVGGVVTYLSTYHESGKFLDLQQRQIARYVGDLTFVAPSQAILPPHDTEDDYVVEVTYADGRPPRSSDTSVIIPDQRSSGFSEFDNAIGHWRVFSLVTPERTVQVAQQTVVREELAANAALSVSAPFLLAAPLSWVVVAFVVNQTFRRLKRLADNISRDGRGFEPIDVASLPEEVAPFALSINDLLSRLHATVDKQKNFLSDAAHELRTPLAALTLQIANLTYLRGPALEGRIVDLQAGALRVSGLTDQLLTISRYESQTDPPETNIARLDDVAKEVVASLFAFSESKGIDIGFTRLEAVEVIIPENDLWTLVEALVDNAVRYTPNGGSVDVSIVFGPEPRLTVANSGQGVLESELPRLTERFFRGSLGRAQGTGLGLAIVQAICQRQNLKLSLSNGFNGTGFVASVYFPRANIKDLNIS